MMKNKVILALLLMLTMPFVGKAQVNVSPFISTGYIQHLNREGVNAELGINVEFIKRINISSGLRYSSLDANSTNQVKIKAISTYLSYVLINKNEHKLMLGPGISYGNYKRYTSPEGFEKEYSNFWLNPVKIRYNYTLPSNFKIGLDASLYGDDGDTSTFFGLVFGYELVNVNTSTSIK